MLDENVLLFRLDNVRNNEVICSLTQTGCLWFPRLPIYGSIVSWRVRTSTSSRNMALVPHLAPLHSLTGFLRTNHRGDNGEETDGVEDKCEMEKYIGAHNFVGALKLGEGWGRGTEAAAVGKAVAVAVTRSECTFKISTAQLWYLIALTRFKSNLCKIAYERWAQQYRIPQQHMQHSWGQQTRRLL